MIQGLIGVIVPVYKVEKYITECIESILAQTYTNFRLILVDDGTPDNAGRICDEYAKKDSRITVIHQENAGVTRARARGVEEADDCEFITFVDGDDTIVTNALETLLSHINGDMAIVISDINQWQKEEKQISIEEYRKGIIYEQNCSLWGKLYKREIINEDSFNISRELYVGEDLLASLRISFNTSLDVIIIPDKIYNYRYNNDSCINVFKPTIEYEVLFHKTLLNTIAEFDSINRYSDSHIRRRLLWWDRLFGYNYKKPNWFGSEYHKQLLADIIKYQYHINYIENLLLKTKNPLARFLLINLRKLKNKCSF